MGDWMVISTTRNFPLTHWPQDLTLPLRGSSNSSSPTGAKELIVNHLFTRPRCRDTCTGKATLYPEGITMLQTQYLLRGGLLASLLPVQQTLNSVFFRFIKGNWAGSTRWFTVSWTFLWTFAYDFRISLSVCDSVNQINIYWASNGNLVYKYFPMYHLI